jgi:hypothetical protein
MQKWTLLIVFVFTLTNALKGQYYYQDLVMLGNNNEQFRLMKKERVTKVTAKSVEATGEVTEGFVMEQTFNASYSQLRSTTQVPGSMPSTLVNYYNGQGLLYRTVDSNANVVNVYEYKYDSLNRIAAITNAGRATDDKVKTIETHVWLYGDNGAPSRMLRVRNGSDTLEVSFTSNDKGQVTEERSVVPAGTNHMIYYYYDDQGRISDVVRFQEQLGRLIPDYTFTYDEAGRLKEMMVVQQSGKDYLIWRYMYGSSGLKEKEACFTRDKRLAGTVEYSYGFKK